MTDTIMTDVFSTSSWADECDDETNGNGFVESVMKYEEDEDDGFITVQSKNKTHRRRNAVFTTGDKMIKCRDCEKDFCFTMVQQISFQSKGWEEPKSCKDCKLYTNTYGKFKKKNDHERKKIIDI